MITITEGLSEINLLKKKITEKQSFSQRMVAHPTHAKDPFESEGGSEAALKSERQAINDLNRRLVKIRSAISKVNIDNKLDVLGDERSIFDWLSWKREVYANEIGYLRNLSANLVKVQDAERKQPQVFEDNDGNKQLVTYKFNADLGEIQKQIEKVEDTYQKLDGLLSLKNATLTIEI